MFPYEFLNGDSLIMDLFNDVKAKQIPSIQDHMRLCYGKAKYFMNDSVLDTDWASNTQSKLSS